MTNDGDIVNKILQNVIITKRICCNGKQTYNGSIHERMGNGIPILDTVTRKCKVEQISKYTFKIILTGIKQTNTSMCEYLGYEVNALKRIRIINISLWIYR